MDVRDMRDGLEGHTIWIGPVLLVARGTNGESRPFVLVLLSHVSL